MELRVGMHAKLDLGYTPVPPPPPSSFNLGRVPVEGYSKQHTIL